MKAEEIRKWESVSGWLIDPDSGKRIRLGNHVYIGKGVNFGGDVTLEEGARVGDFVSIGGGARLGRYVWVGNRSKLGDYVVLGKGVSLGDKVVLGDWVVLTDGVELASGATSEALNLQAIENWKRLGDKHLFYKWVEKDRTSINFDGGKKIEYRKGEIVEVPDAVISDQQCAPGLHVLRYGYRPEWVGLCSASHDYICLEVEVRSEDILFGGLPSMDAKLRVRRLKVLT